MRCRPRHNDSAAPTCSRKNARWLPHLTHDLFTFDALRSSVLWPHQSQRRSRVERGRAVEGRDVAPPGFDSSELGPFTVQVSVAPVLRVNVGQTATLAVSFGLMKAMRLRAGLAMMMACTEFVPTVTL